MRDLLGWAALWAAWPFVSVLAAWLGGPIGCLLVLVGWPIMLLGFRGPKCDCLHAPYGHYRNCRR